MTIEQAKALIKKQGPCAFCGGPYAAHRTIDAQMDQVTLGAMIELVAEDYGERSVAVMVTKWAALMDLLHDKVQAECA